MKPVNILCIKWGNKYDAEYVNKLYSMVARNMERPFRFVCLTDDQAGIREEVESKEIPQVGFKDFDERLPWTFAHGWLKVTAFAEPLYDLEGTTLFIDLDVVIVDSLEPFFQEEGEFLVIKEWDKSDATGNTSVFRYEIGAHADIIEYLQEDPEKATADVRNEQEFVTQYLDRQGKLKYWPEAWVRSFKRHCARLGPVGWLKEPKLPEEAKIIAFHGKPNPPDAIAGRSGKWYRKVLPTSWVAEHWR